MGRRSWFTVEKNRSILPPALRLAGRTVNELDVQVRADLVHVAAGEVAA
jgi:hypothetical protein